LLVLPNKQFLPGFVPSKSAKVGFLGRNPDPKIGVLFVKINLSLLVAQQLKN